jgi:hypothetical protein
MMEVVAGWGGRSHPFCFKAFPRPMSIKPRGPDDEEQSFRLQLV